jgi:gliding motility-associated lipoprotein GldH
MVNKILSSHRTHLLSFFILKNFLKSIRLLIIFVFLISLASCDKSVVFEENVKMPDNRWEQKNIVELKTEITDSITPHNIYINVRNAGGYQFSNLFIFFTTVIPSGKMERDTIEITLADETGKWLGDGLGDIWDNRQLFKNNFRFPEKGTYTFTLEQAMRINPLPQIMDVGIRIEKAK